MKLELITRKPEKQTFPAPILFVHGAWGGAWCWEEYFMSWFSGQGYQCYATSFRGHGESEGRETLLRNLARDYVADLVQAVSDVEGQTGQRPILVSHSLGGYVTQKFLENHAVPAAVLLATIPSYGALPFFLRFFARHPLAFLHAAVTLNGWYFISTPALTREAFFSSDMPDAQVNAYFERMIPESFIAGFEACINLPRPGKVRTPVLVLGGADDQIFTQAELRRTARDYHSEAEFFPNMAHDMMLEKDWQKVADRIMAWLGDHAVAL